MNASKPGIVRVGAWASYPWLRAGFSTREGGGTQAYSGGQTREQNLGWTEADPPETVAANRRGFLAEVGAGSHFKLATVAQFHTDITQNIEAGRGPLMTPEGKAVLRGDGLMTSLPNILLGVQTADCVPVLVADTKTRVVAAFHAGWRGTVARIVEQGISEMQRRHGSEAADIVAAIGPCIGVCCFEVGEEVRAGFKNQFSYGGELFSDSGSRIHLDLVEANRRQLLQAGIPAQNISAVGECTGCARLESGRRKYFSHRAEKGFTGRMLSVTGVAAD